MKFSDLRSGDVVTLRGVRSVVMAIESPHPLNPSFLLIVWFLFGQNRLSFDMLHPDYDLITGTSVSKDGMVSYQEALDLIHYNSGQV
jgi:hypothetical protein